MFFCPLEHLWVTAFAPFKMTKYIDTQINRHKFSFRRLFHIRVLYDYKIHAALQFLTAKCIDLQGYFDSMHNYPCQKRLKVIALYVLIWS